MSPDDRDRTEIRRQQIEEIQDMIAWEKRHDWGRPETQTRGLTSRLVRDLQRLIMSLEGVIAYLERAKNPGTVRRSKVISPEPVNTPTCPTRAELLDRH